MDLGLKAVPTLESCLEVWEAVGGPCKLEVVVVVDPFSCWLSKCECVVSWKVFGGSIEINIGGKTQWLHFSVGLIFLVVVVILRIETCE